MVQWLQSIDDLASNPKLKADAMRDFKPYEGGYMNDVKDSLSIRLHAMVLAGDIDVVLIEFTAHVIRVIARPQPPNDPNLVRLNEPLDPHWTSPS